MHEHERAAQAGAAGATMHATRTPVDFDRVSRIVDALHDAGIVPHRLEARAIALVGAELGLEPAEACRVLHARNGTITMRAELLLERARAAGVRIDVLHTSGSACVVEGERAGVRPHRVHVSFRKDAQLPESIRHRGAWLRARCISAVVRMVAPEVARGISTPEDHDGDDRHFIFRGKVADAASDAQADIAPTPPRTVADVELVLERVLPLASRALIPAMLEPLRWAGRAKPAPAPSVPTPATPAPSAESRGESMAAAAEAEDDTEARDVEATNATEPAPTPSVPLVSPEHPLETVRLADPSPSAEAMEAFRVTIAALEAKIRDLQFSAVTSEDLERLVAGQAGAVDPDRVSHDSLRAAYPPPVAPTPAEDSLEATEPPEPTRPVSAEEVQAAGVAQRAADRARREVEEAEAAAYVASKAAEPAPTFVGYVDAAEAAKRAAEAPAVGFVSRDVATILLEHGGDVAAALPEIASLGLAPALDALAEAGIPAMVQRQIASGRDATAAQELHEAMTEALARRTPEERAALSETILPAIVAEGLRASEHADKLHDAAIAEAFKGSNLNTDEAVRELFTREAVRTAGILSELPSSIRATIEEGKLAHPFRDPGAADEAPILEAPPAYTYDAASLEVKIGETVVGSPFAGATTLEEALGEAPPAVAIAEAPAAAFPPGSGPCAWCDDGRSPGATECACGRPGVVTPEHIRRLEEEDAARAVPPSPIEAPTPAPETSNEPAPVEVVKPEKKGRAPKAAKEGNPIDHLPREERQALAAAAAVTPPAPAPKLSPEESLEAFDAALCKATTADEIAATMDAHRVEITKATNLEAWRATWAKHFRRIEALASAKAST